MAIAWFNSAVRVSAVKALVGNGSASPRGVPKADHAARDFYDSGFLTLPIEELVKIALVAAAIGMAGLR